MARKTKSYEVTYQSGAKRVKLLNNSDAERLEKSPAVKSVKLSGGSSAKKAPEPANKAKDVSESK